MAKTHPIRQKHYPKNSMEGVLKEFYILEDIVEKSGHPQTNAETRFIRHSAVIRLVTIIEQFFHAVLVKKIRDRSVEYDNHDIKIHKALLVDAIRSAEYGWHGTYPKGVEEYIRQFLTFEEPSEARSDRCKLSKERLTKLLEPYCHAKPSDFWYMFIANERSLQDACSILHEMEKHEIIVFDDSDAELSTKNYDKLFDARHILVHTMNDAVIDVMRYMKSTMRLFKRVLKNAGYDEPYVARVCGIALHEAGRYDEAISVLQGLVKQAPHDGIMFQTLGESYYAKGNGVFGKTWLMIAMNKAREVHEMFGTQSHPRGAAYVSKVDLPNVWINNALLYRAIGVTFQLNDEKDLAVQCFEAALIQCPSYILLQLDIGSTFVGMRMNEKAIRCFENVVAAESTNMFALDQLGILYGVSDPKEAERYYKMVLELEPENESAKSGLESLSDA